MMLIYRCDNCGAEHTVDQIVANEFAYTKAGFGSLAVPVAGKRDLCGSCMKVAEDAHRNASRECAASAEIVKQMAISGALSTPRPHGPFRSIADWIRNGKRDGMGRLIKPTHLGQGQ